MFQATVLSIVLVFAGGPSASLFCKAWCDPHTAPASGCHHEDNAGPAGLSSDDSCDDSVQGNAILLKEDLRRASAEGAGKVIAAAHFQLALIAATLQAVGNQGRVPSDLQRPLTRPLRI